MRWAPLPAKACPFIGESRESYLVSKTSKMAERVLDIPVTQGILAHLQGVAWRRHIFSHVNASCFRRVTSGLFRMAQLTGKTAWLIDGLHGWPRFVSKSSTSEPRNYLPHIHRQMLVSLPEPGLFLYNPSVRVYLCRNRVQILRSHLSNADIIRGFPAPGLRKTDTRNVKGPFTSFPGEAYRFSPPYPHQQSMRFVILWLSVTDRTMRHWCIQGYTRLRVPELPCRILDTEGGQKT